MVDGYVWLYVHVSVNTFSHWYVCHYVYTFDGTNISILNASVTYFQVSLLKDSSDCTDFTLWLTIVVAFIIAGTLWLCSNKPNNVFVIITSRVAPMESIVCPTFRGFILPLNVSIVNVFLVVCYHYASGYYDHYNTTCDCCVLWSITHYDSYTCCHFYGLDNKLWFCCHSWFQGTQWGVLLTSPMCHSNNNLSPGCLLPSEAYANYAMESPLVIFTFRVEPPNSSQIMCWCLLWCLLSAFRVPCGCCIHLWQLNIGVCNNATLWILCLAGICTSMDNL